MGTLDGRNITISTKPGEVIKQADIKMVRGEGMPTHKDPFNKGKLIVLFNITFPEKLDPSVAAKLAALLPKPKKQEIPAGSEDCAMEVFDGKPPTINLAGEATWGGEKTQREDDYKDAG